MIALAVKCEIHFDYIVVLFCKLMLFCTWQQILQKGVVFTTVPSVYSQVASVKVMYMVRLEEKK